MERSIRNLMAEYGISRKMLYSASERLASANAMLENGVQLEEMSAFTYKLDYMKDEYSFVEKFSLDTILSENMWNFLVKQWNIYNNSVTVSELATECSLPIQSFKKYVSDEKTPKVYLSSYIHMNVFSPQKRILRYDIQKVVNGYLLSYAKHSTLNSTIANYAFAHDSDTGGVKSLSYVKIHRFEEVIVGSAIKARVIGFIRMNNLVYPIVINLANKNLSVLKDVKLYPKNREPLNLRISKSMEDFKSPVTFTFSLNEFSDKGKSRYLINVLLDSANQNQFRVAFRQGGTDLEPVFSIIIDTLTLDMNRYQVSSQDSTKIKDIKKRSFGSISLEALKKLIARHENGKVRYVVLNTGKISVSPMYKKIGVAFLRIVLIKRGSWNLLNICR